MKIVKAEVYGAPADSFNPSSAFVGPLPVTSELYKEA